MHLKSVAWKRVSPNFQNYKCHEVDQCHSKKLLWSSTSYISIENTKRTCLLFKRAVKFWPTFYVQTSITLVIFWEKLQNYTFREPTEVSQNKPTFTSKNGPLKNEKNMFFGSFFFKIRTANILNF